MNFPAGIIIGAWLCAVLAAFFWTNTDSYLLGQEVQKVIGVCEEKLPRNEKCTFMIVPESKLIYGEEEK
jgi:hypothetical protein